MSDVLRLLVAYDGTAFAGFQIQPGLRTVQGALEDALSTVRGIPVRVRGAGRTDAGVHALGQVVSVDGWDGPDPEAVLGACASLLPRDVSVLDAQRGPDAFDARRSARWRAYTYLLWTADARHPMLHRYSWWMRRPVDVRTLRDALGVVAGTHDFRSFARVREDQEPQRTLLEATAEADGDLVRIRIVGESFLHQMVRSIVGSAVEVASGRRTLAWMREALLARDRSAAGPVAPPQGLTLTDVGYEDAAWSRRPVLTWPWSAMVPARDEVAGGLL